MRRWAVLIARPGRAPELLLAPSRAGFERARDACLVEWQAERPWLDEQRSVLGTPAGHRARLVEVEQLESRPAIGVICYDFYRHPTEIYLVADRASAEFLARHALVAGGRAELVTPGDVASLPDCSAAARPLRDRLLRALEPTAGRFVPALSDARCPRCDEQRLHVEAVYDSRSRLDGRRICNPCAMIEVLRRAS